MDNLDMAKLMNMLSKVDKKDLEKSMEIANKIMKSENKDEIIKNLKNNLNLNLANSLIAIGYKRS